MMRLHVMIGGRIGGGRIGKAGRSILCIGAVMCFAPSALADERAETAGQSALAEIDFGKPATVTSVRQEPGLGATIVTFSTGTRLIVRPIRIEPGQVSVTAWLGNGRAGVPERLVHALWASTLLPLGGTKRFAYGDLDQWQRQTATPVTVTFVPGISAFQWKGTVPSASLADELRLLADFAREPAFRPEMAAKIATIGPMIANQIEGSAASTFQRGVQHSLTGSSRYQELPEKADIAATTGNELSEMLKPTLGVAADVAIVGDVRVVDAIRATAVSFAAGKPRPVAGHIEAVAVPPRRGAGSFGFAHAGDPADAWLGEYWTLPDLVAAPRTMRVAKVAAAVIEARFSAALPLHREGATTPLVRAGGSPELKGGNALGIVLELQPGDIAEAKERIAAMLRGMREGKFGAEEIVQAREVVAARHRAEEASNEWWAQRLVLGLREPRLARAISNARGGKDVSVGEVTSFVRCYLSQIPIIVSAQTARSDSIDAADPRP